MGLRGPKPGTGSAARCGRKPTRTAPAAADGKAPACPFGKATPEGREWAKLVAAMAQAGTLGEAYASAMAEYCTCYVDLQRLRANVRKHGYSQMGKNGPQGRPEAQAMMRLAGSVRGYLDAFGLTPSGGQRVGKPKDKGQAGGLAALMDKMDAVRRGE